MVLCVRVCVFYLFVKIYLSRCFEQDNLVGKHFDSGRNSRSRRPRLVAKNSNDYTITQSSSHKTP
ncbi:hypothetical protein ABFS83_08G172000 [Erythranthe nasuta]